MRSQRVGHDFPVIISIHYGDPDMSLESFLKG